MPQGDSDQPQILLSYEDAVAALVDQGIPKKDAIRTVAKERGVSRREVYNAVEQG